MELSGRLQTRLEGGLFGLTCKGTAQDWPTKEAAACFCFTGLLRERNGPLRGPGLLVPGSQQLHGYPLGAGNGLWTLILGQGRWRLKHLSASLPPSKALRRASDLRNPNICPAALRGFGGVGLMPHIRGVDQGVFISSAAP